MEGDGAEGRLGAGSVEVQVGLDGFGVGEAEQRG